jgi:hypothetical protein
MRTREGRIPPMPRKSEEQKAREALPRWEERLAKARRDYADDPDSITSLLDVSWGWLMAALRQRKDAGKRDAAALYKEVTDSLSGFAREIQEKTASGK